MPWLLRVHGANFSVYLSLKKMTCGVLWGVRKIDQCLWLFMHLTTSQILACHVGKRIKASGEALMAKLPAELKKSLLFHRCIFKHLGRFFELNLIVFKI